MFVTIMCTAQRRHLGIHNILLRSTFVEPSSSDQRNYVLTEKENETTGHSKNIAKYLKSMRTLEIESKYYTRRCCPFVSWKGKLSYFLLGMICIKA
jgi:hypothetical protein